MSTTIKTDELDQWHECGVYKTARLIDCMGPIDDEKSAQVIKNIRLLDFVNDKDITILINTPGGDVDQGMAIFDAIKECNSKVITHAVGPCHSMGSIILQAGDYRKVSSNAKVMIHRGSVALPEDHDDNVERWMKETKTVRKKMDEILLKKIKKVKPRFKMEQLQKMLVFDTILNADKAIEYGLADIIVEHKEF